MTQSKPNNNVILIFLIDPSRPVTRALHESTSELLKLFFKTMIWYLKGVWECSNNYFSKYFSIRNVLK